MIRVSAHCAWVLFLKLGCSVGWRYEAVRCSVGSRFAFAGRALIEAIENTKSPEKPVKQRGKAASSSGKLGEEDEDLDAGAPGDVDHFLGVRLRVVGFPALGCNPRGMCTAAPPQKTVEFEIRVAAHH